jgi:formate dehydrogenase subunit beta
MEDAIREKARSWLAQGLVDCFLGFRRRPDGTAVPVRITDASEADRLVFGDGCVHNLVSLVDLKSDERTGILLKGCDGRSLVQLIAEGELDRERFRVLGVVCPGLTEGGEEAAKCGRCRANTPPLYDELITPGDAEQWDRGLDDAEVDSLLSMDRSDRFDFFRKHFDRCIRCYACRDACPLCYCRECVTEKSRPQWVEVGVKPSSNAYWNLIRAYHLAGRCVDCGECDRACPVGIPLRLLNRRLSAIVSGLFEYVPGESTEATPAMLDFREDEEHLEIGGHGS